MKKLTWNIPLRTVSELNCSQHWAIKAKRHRLQKKIIKIALAKDIKQVSLPCEIKIIRISTQKMDYDNLVASNKYLVDGICELLIPGLAAGRADGDERIKVDYGQEKGSRHSIRIEITFT